MPYRNFRNEAVAEAEKSDVEQTFSLLRQRKTNLQFSYEGTDETVFDPKQKFKISFYFQILDTTIQSLQRRFGGIDKCHDLFGFLGNFQNLDSDVIKRSYMDLDLALQIQHEGNVCKDIDGLDLHNEILSYKVLNPITDSSKISDSPIDILNYITKKTLQSLFPNLFIALRIFLTLPISVASGERSFSKLKLIKNYLRMSMCQENLSDLAVISIENKICEAIDHNEMINELASVKSRRIML
ncbi:zinc finger MYM-type protein 1-like [Diabrotica undecimpunctata]|uniref:zinc finger MYM-type protein 1-like n=1 Tax=Diabrotica undecimpunctata TaxID=50387 RepID=UPI003B63A8B5